MQSPLSVVKAAQSTTAVASKKRKEKRPSSKGVMSDEDFAAENESQMNEFRSETHDELHVSAIGHKPFMSIEEECKMCSPLFLV